MLPKAGSRAVVEALADFGVIPLCETVAGIVNSGAIATAENCIALFFGAEDLTADLGGRASRDRSGRYYPPMEFAAAQVLFAAVAAGKLAIAPVHLALDDADRLRAESDAGFGAKGCVHPRQVSAVRAAFAPTPDQLEWARSLLAAGEHHRSGVFQFRGQMVDGPAYGQARNILARAGELWTSN